MDGAVATRVRERAASLRKAGGTPRGCSRARCAAALAWRPRLASRQGRLALTPQSRRSCAQCICRSTWLPHQSLLCRCRCLLGRGRQQGAGQGQDSGARDGAVRASLRATTSLRAKYRRAQPPTMQGEHPACPARKQALNTPTGNGAIGVGVAHKVADLPRDLQHPLQVLHRLRGAGAQGGRSARGKGRLALRAEPLSLGWTPNYSLASERVQHRRGRRTCRSWPCMRALAARPRVARRSFTRSPVTCGGWGRGRSQGGGQRRH